MRRASNIFKRLLRESMYTYGSPDLQTVQDAIANKNYVRIRYDDEDYEKDSKSRMGTRKNSRLIMPFALGTSKAGNTVLRAFQVNGGTRRGAPGWKEFIIDKIINWATMSRKQFHQTPDELGFDNAQPFNKYGDKGMTNIIQLADFSDVENMSPLERERMFGMDRLNGPVITARGFESIPNMRQRRRMSASGMSRDDIMRNIEMSKGEESAFDVWDKAAAEASNDNSGARDTDMVRRLGRSDNTRGSIGGEDFEDHNADEDEYSKFFNGEELSDEEVETRTKVNDFGDEYYEDEVPDTMPDSDDFGEDEDFPKDEDEDNFK